MAFNGWSPGVRHRLSEYEEPADRQSDDQGDCGEPKKRRGKLQKPDHEYQLADWPTGRRVGVNGLRECAPDDRHQTGS